MNAKQRIAIALLTISAGAVVKIQVEEGYTDHAVIPVKGDRPTIGHGSTTRLDGSPVQMGDTTTPALAKQRTLASDTRAHRSSAASECRCIKSNSM